MYICTCKHMYNFSVCKFMRIIKLSKEDVYKKEKWSKDLNWGNEGADKEQLVR